MSYTVWTNYAPTKERVARRSYNLEEAFKEMSDKPIEMTPTKPSLCRPGSLLAPDPHVQLSAAYRARDLGAFEELLRNREVDPDYWYDEPTFATMLDLASRDPGRTDYVRALLRAGADPNRLNPVRKKAPIHMAAEAANADTLAVLLQVPTTDVNRKDNTGSTALHLAAKEDGATTGATRELTYRYQRCIQLIMDRSDVQINTPNRKGLTAVHIAALYASPDTLQHLLVRGGSRLDVDSYEDASGQTARQTIVERHPSLTRLLPPAQDADATNDSPRLFYHLYCGEDETFVQALSKYNGSLDANDGSHTLLQLACEKGLVDSVSALLDAGTDTNATSATERRPPLHLAAFRGYYRIVRRLLAIGADAGASPKSETALHAAVKGAGETNIPLGASALARNHHKTVDELLKVVPNGRLNVNATDIKGNSALHYAARLGDNDLVLALLRGGAYIGVRNRLGEPPLADISPRALEAYLDECIQTNDLLPREDNYEVILKYGFLAPAGLPPPSQPVPPEVEAARLEPKSVHSSQTPLPETDPLLYMSRSVDLRHLLKHPIITSFLQLKWHLIRSYFYLNLLFYLAFWVFLTAYILFGFSTEDQQADALVPNSNSSSNATAGMGQSPHLANTILSFLGIFTTLLAFRELFQLVVSPTKYITSLENWMEIFLILVTFTLLGRDTESYARQQLSAVAILLSWAELVLLIGRHPMLSTNIEMFKTVSINFLKFLAWYSILIVAFALSFYTLFRKCYSSSCEDDEENLFLSPGKSVFKAVVMLTGEFDASSIPFKYYPGTSHILFVLFIFLIAIVLFNLLNGLAVSDTQAIREDAELVAYISRVKFIAYVEHMVMGPSGPSTEHGIFKTIQSFCCCLRTCTTVGCLRTISNKINLFPDNVPDRQIHVLPNQCNRIEFTNTLDCKKTRSFSQEEEDSCICCGQRSGSCRTVSMDPYIMRSVKNLLSKRDEIDENSRLQMLYKNSQEQIKLYMQQMEEYRQKFDDLFSSNKRTEEALSTILARLNK